MEPGVSGTLGKHDPPWPGPPPKCRSLPHFFSLFSRSKIKQKRLPPKALQNLKSQPK